jgi:hypothetical protein
MREIHRPSPSRAKVRDPAEATACVDFSSPESSTQLFARLRGQILGGVQRSILILDADCGVRSKRNSGSTCDRYTKSLSSDRSHVAGCGVPAFCFDLHRLAHLVESPYLHLPSARHHRQKATQTQTTFGSTTYRVMQLGPSKKLTSEDDNNSIPGLINT